jgi:flap endonuclease-1
VSYTESKREADQTIAWLARSRGIGDVLSSDSDLLAYGVPRLWVKGGSGKNAGYTLYDRAKILGELALTEGQFMDLCLLLGCDYTNDIKFKGIGPKTALSLINKHGSIENI